MLTEYKPAINERINQCPKYQELGVDNVAFAEGLSLIWNSCIDSSTVCWAYQDLSEWNYAAYKSLLAPVNGKTLEGEGLVEFHRVRGTAWAVRLTAKSIVLLINYTQKNTPAGGE